MGWPQYVALVWIVLTQIAQIRASVKLGDTPNQATCLVLMDLLKTVIVVLVLSAGGFW